MALIRVFRLFTVAMLLMPRHAANSPAQLLPQDLDRDGIPDELEQELAERYAPIVYYSADEPNLPTNVPEFLRLTGLWYYDPSCRPTSRKIAQAVAPAIPRFKMQPCRPADRPVDDWNSRSARKERTFFLPNVSPSARRGSVDSKLWTTYFHAYPNSQGGMTIQYWRFYAYNTSEFWGHRAAVGNHGGDWEAIHIVLGPAPQYAPRQIVLLGHRDITRERWSSALVSGSHVLIASSKGGHTSSLLHRVPDLRHAIRHESWTAGSVHWPNGKTSAGGPLVNLGEKTAPMPGMSFLRYSGLWGTRVTSGWFTALDSGYWGPAYNETGTAPDGFVTAWCDGMADLGRSIPDEVTGAIRECYAGN